MLVYEVTKEIVSRRMRLEWAAEITKVAAKLIFRKLVRYFCALCLVVLLPVLLRNESAAHQALNDFGCQAVCLVALGNSQRVVKLAGTRVSGSLRRPPLRS